MPLFTIVYEVAKLGDGSEETWRRRPVGVSKSRMAKIMSVRGFRMQFEREYGTLGGGRYAGIGIVKIPASSVVEGTLDVVHKTQHGSLLFAAYCMHVLALLSK